MSPAPAADASGELPAELIRRVRRIQIRARRRATGLLAGEYASAFKGHGIEVEEVREYQPGDDVRRIDWHVTARTGAPHVQVHREERELSVLLAVDVSASGRFGSGERLKQEVAAEVAALIAYAALRSNDRVGLLLFTDRVERFVPPKKGRGHAWRVIREVLAARPEGRGTDLGAALEAVVRLARRGGVVFVLSDFLADGYDEALRVAARRHEVVALVLADPRERSLPPLGLLEVEDPESGRHRTVDSSDPGFRRALERRREERAARRAGLLVAAGVDEVEIATDRPWVADLERYFRARERRR